MPYAQFLPTTTIGECSPEPTPAVEIEGGDFDRPPKGPDRPMVPYWIYFKARCRGVMAGLARRARFMACRASSIRPS